MRPMKTIIFWMLAILYVAPPAWSKSEARTDAGSCYVIADSDGRAYCLAVAHQNPGRCYTIQDGGLRARCLAETRK